MANAKPVNPQSKESAEAAAKAGIQEEKEVVSVVTPEGAKKVTVVAPGFTVVDY